MIRDSGGYEYEKSIGTPTERTTRVLLHERRTQVSCHWWTRVFGTIWNLQKFNCKIRLNFKFRWEIYRFNYSCYLLVTIILYIHLAVIIHSIIEMRNEDNDEIASNRLKMC